MRLIAPLLLAVAFAANAADDEYSTGRIVDASQGTELRAGLFGSGVSNANANSLTVELDGMRYTVDYQTILSGGKNAASNFVVGTEVQARVHKDKWLVLLRPDGKTLRVRITRRELVASD